MKDVLQRPILPELCRACVIISAASFGWHRRRRMRVANFSLPHKVAKWVNESEASKQLLAGCPTS
eukprot:9863588-Heterocapsa_arctica.AAC.1